jgi:hypothetical protein
VKWRPILIASLTGAAAAVIVVWVIHSRQVGYWFRVHTVTSNESGPYYGFWSGFGSDLEEFGILGAVGAGVYQLVKKYNCHEPGCWRVGQHPAAGGQFLLCYRHHPDYQGRKPTRELIDRLHREHLEREAAIHGKLDESASICCPSRPPLRRPRPTRPNRSSTTAFDRLPRYRRRTYGQAMIHEAR